MRFHFQNRILSSVFKFFSDYFRTKNFFKALFVLGKRAQVYPQVEQKKERKTNKTFLFLVSFQAQRERTNRKYESIVIDQISIIDQYTPRYYYYDGGGGLIDIHLLRSSWQDERTNEKLNWTELFQCTRETDLLLLLVRSIYRSLSFHHHRRRRSRRRRFFHNSWEWVFYLCPVVRVLRLLRPLSEDDFDDDDVMIFRRRSTNQDQTKHIDFGHDGCTMDD